MSECCLGMFMKVWDGVLHPMAHGAFFAFHHRKTIVLATVSASHTEVNLNSKSASAADGPRSPFFTFYLSKTIVFGLGGSPGAQKIAPGTVSEVRCDF